MKRKQMTDAELSILCMALHEIWHAGLPLAEGLQAMREDDDDADTRALMETLGRATEQGQTLPVALEQAGGFPRYMIEPLLLAETTGRQEETLRALSAYYDRRDRMAHSLRSAVLYPALLAVVMLLVIGVLVTQVLPIFSSVFEQLGTQMSAMAMGFMRGGQAA